MDLLRSICRHYPNHKGYPVHWFLALLVSYRQAKRLQHLCPSNPRLNRNLNQLLCIDHHQRLYRNRVRSLCQGFELDDHLDNLQYHLGWCLTAGKNLVFHHCHHQHHTCPAIHRCRRRYPMNQESHHYRCLGL